MISFPYHESYAARAESAIVSADIGIEMLEPIRGNQQAYLLRRRMKRLLRDLQALHASLQQEEVSA